MRKAAAAVAVFHAASAFFTEENRSKFKIDAVLPLTERKSVPVSKIPASRISYYLIMDTSNMCTIQWVRGSCYPIMTYVKGMRIV